MAEFKKEAGLKSFSPLQAFDLFLNPPTYEPVHSAYKKFRRRQIKLAIIVVAWILVLTIGAAIIREVVVPKH